jgi:flagella basal body P-ring formation protein FlgA
MLTFVAMAALSAAAPEESPVAAAFAQRPAKAESAAPLVKRNAIVVMEFVRGPLSIIAEGRALSAGAEGETVKVLNTSSRIAVSALVVGPNRVRVRQ